MRFGGRGALRDGAEFGERLAAVEGLPGPGCARERRAGGGSAHARRGEHRAWKHAQQLVGGAFTSGATGEVDAVDFTAGEVEPVDLPGSFDRLQVAGREGEVGESHPEPEREQGDDECRSAERAEALRTRIEIGEESRPALDRKSVV